MSGHRFIRPGQVAPDRPAPDQCMVCGEPEARHGGGGLRTAGQLDALVSVLGPALAEWAGRDQEAGATAGQVRAGNAAMAAIDDLTAALHRMRSQLVAERRADSDARAARVDAMLAECRARREAGQE